MSSADQNRHREQRGRTRSPSPHRHHQDRSRERGYRRDHSNSRDEYGRSSRGYREDRRSDRRRSPDRHRNSDRHRNLDRRRRSRSAERRPYRNERDNHRSRFDRDNCPRRRPDEGSEGELKVAIWAPTPTASEDERDQLEEDKVIAKMQNRFAAKPPRPESPNNSDSRSYSSSEYTSSQSSDEEEPRKTSKQPLPAESKTPERQSDAELSEPEIGPMPAQSQQPLLSARSFGKALLPGEGMAMAAFVQSGERIPRRGEIGMDQDRIDRLEGAGYVMSGNRHGRMNAVRLRKEGQVITAEEKRQMLLQNQEERQAKESQIIAEFREMLAKKK